jgi:hypothetical protein
MFKALSEYLSSTIIQNKGKNINKPIIHRYLSKTQTYHKHIWDKNDLDRYFCTTCSLQHLASTWVHPGFSMGSMLLILQIHSMANHKDEQHGSHRKTGMNPGAGKMLK